jgi:hypothetical protein
VQHILRMNIIWHDDRDQINFMRILRVVQVRVPVIRVQQYKYLYFVYLMYFDVAPVGMNQIAKQKQLRKQPLSCFNS